MNATATRTNTEFRAEIDRITQEYRNSVARRAAQQKAREARAERFQEINEIFQAFVCAGFIFLTWMFFAENAAQMTWPTQGIICTACFLLAQACGWTYIVWVLRKYGVAFRN